MFNSILVANRGEIACRIIKTARLLGIKTIAVYSDADKNALHVDMANEAIHIGPATPSESYLNIEKILSAIEISGAEAVHPGYGFHSENAEFAELLETNNIVFIGPEPSAIRIMGDKLESKRLAQEVGVPTVPSSEDSIEDVSTAKVIAKEIGYPIMLKASAGGGGKGMRCVETQSQLNDALKLCISEAEGSFGDSRVFMEKFITKPRHIEFQVLGDKFGNLLHLGERECSVQRRHQKVIEEAPSPFLTNELREEMGEKAVELATAVDYTSAGTVEFIVAPDKQFYFLEMNTRLQVEHAVTEVVTGLDLVELMIRVASGEKLSFTQDDVVLNGWAIESRVYAEDPSNGFLPSTGRLIRYMEPVTSAFGIIKNVRVDGGVNEGDRINQYYDPLIAKLITNGGDRAEAIRHMRWALDEYYLRGPKCNLSFLSAIFASKRFQKGDIDTNFIFDEFGERFIANETSHENIDAIVAIACAANCLFIGKHSSLGVQALDGTDVLSQKTEIDKCWVVIWNNISFEAEAYFSTDDIKIIVDGKVFDIKTEWRLGSPIFVGKINDELIVAQIEKVGSTFNIQHGGLSANLQVLSTNAAKMLSFIPEKNLLRKSNNVVSPMPGILVSIDVVEGQEVSVGQLVSVIEAMKMENQIFSECSGVIKKIHLGPGDMVSPGQLILEIE